MCVCVRAVYKATIDEGYVVTAFLLLMGINVLFAIIASAFIVIEVCADMHLLCVHMYMYILLHCTCKFSNMLRF